MGDVDIANQLIDGVKSALAAVGNTVTLSVLPNPVIDDADPGSDPSQPAVNTSIEAFLYKFDDKYMPGSTVEQGELLAIVDLSTLTEIQVAGISIGDSLIDGTTTYRITNSNPIVVAGKTVSIIFQLEK